MLARLRLMQKGCWR
ncbi:hypothetical protein [Shigella sonnei]|nr:hypothetical protein [Shigella sonnei]